MRLARQSTVVSYKESTMTVRLIQPSAYAGVGAAAIAHGAQHEMLSSLGELAMLAIPGAFLPIHRLDTPPHDEWMAVLLDGTEIVVADVEGKPSPLGIEKAVAIVQSRAYLESRARHLLAPFGKEKGEWRLLAIDFGIETLHHDCEFLMCFAFQTTQSDLAATDPYVEVGFALPVRRSVSAGHSSMFVLTVQTAAGLEG